MERQLQNPNLILRDYEFFHLKYGLGFYHKDIARRIHALMPYANGHNRQIWLPRETHALKDKLTASNAILIQGQLGAGKSALMYGLRSINREEKEPYCYIDGHRTAIQAPKVASAISWSRKHNATVYFDSMDYLIASSSKKRKMPITASHARTRAIIDELHKFVDDGGQLVGTSHTPSWIAKYCNPDLSQEIWQELLAKFHIHNVEGRFDTPEEITYFFAAADFNPAQASVLANLYSGETKLRLGLPELVTRSIAEYRICKLIALDPRPDAQNIRALVKSCEQGEVSPQILISDLEKFILAKNRETRLKMGA